MPWKSLGYIFIALEPSSTLAYPRPLAAQCVHDQDSFAPQAILRQGSSALPHEDVLQSGATPLAEVTRTTLMSI